MKCGTLSQATESIMSSVWSGAAQQVGWGKMERACLRKSCDTLSQQERTSVGRRSGTAGRKEASLGSLGGSGEEQVDGAPVWLLWFPCPGCDGAGVGFGVKDKARASVQCE